MGLTPAKMKKYALFNFLPRVHAHRKELLAALVDHRDDSPGSARTLGLTLASRMPEVEGLAAVLVSDQAEIEEAADAVGLSVGMLSQIRKIADLVNSSDVLSRALLGAYPRFEAPGSDPAGAAFYRRLALDRRTATLHGGGGAVVGDVAGSGEGLDPATEERFRQRQLEAGQALGRAFLPAEVDEALRGVLDAARRSGSTLELALEVDDGLAHLPWEILVLPGAAEPLALDPVVYLYRAIAGTGTATAWTIPGPLRILVAIGRPEAQDSHGEFPDMERELTRVLDAVEPVRRHDRARSPSIPPERRARVEVIECGTVEAIREALEAKRYHVLHLSCHAGPGVLILEDDEGREDKVTAERLCSEAIPSGRGVPLVVLAGSSTALDPKANGDDERCHYPGLARDLLEHGVSAVVAVPPPIGDRYLTQIVSSLYVDLATAERPEPLRALAQARRQVEEMRRCDNGPPGGGRGARQGMADLAEWSAPVLFLRRPEKGTAADLPLYDPCLPFDEIRRPAEVTFAPGVATRPVGEFVGRRRDQHHLLRLLRASDGGAVVVRGLGGVGKSTLAAELARTLARDGWAIVSVVGETTPEDVLEEVSSALFALARAQGLDERHPTRQISGALRQRDADWNDRLRLLSDHVLGQLPLLLLLDDFEDNLTDDAPAFRNDDLGAFLGGWLARPGRSRLLVTCRRPVPWGDGAAAVDWHLGPLSFAETRKLIWRLPGLDALTPEEKYRAWTDVGGHPRALEYLDALLCHGEARFPDVARRMEASLRARGIEDPEAWLAEQEGGLDKALAEAVTLAVDDVLLGRLLDSLAEVPLAGRLLLGASVYRVPVDEAALVWQVGEIPSDLPEEDVDEFPEVEAPSDFVTTRETLEAAGLLAPFALTDDGRRRYGVHRWTAGALASRAGEEERKEAHRRAAAYWRWRFAAIDSDYEEFLEARFHHHQAGSLDEAVRVTEWVCAQLDTWGAYQREEQLCREVLRWVPQRSKKASVFLHQLGIVAQKRGSYDEASGWYRKALRIDEELGHRDGMAAAYHQLGMVAQDRGSYDEASSWYRKSLQITEELGNRAGMATSYHQLGTVARARGSYDEASSWYRRSLRITEELGDSAGMANSYGALGTVAQARGSYDEALSWHRKALQIFEELGDSAGMANSYGALGTVAQKRGSYDEAWDGYRKALQIFEKLGDRAGMAASYHQLGMTLRDLGKPAEGIPYVLQSLAIHLEIRSPNVRNNLVVLKSQRELLGEERFRALVAKHAGEGSVATVLGGMALLEET